MQEYRNAANKLSRIVYSKLSKTLVPITIITFLAGIVLDKPTHVLYLLFSSIIVTTLISSIRKTSSNWRILKLLLSSNLYYLVVVLWISGVNSHNNGGAMVLLAGMTTIIFFPTHLVRINILNFTVLSTLAFLQNWLWSGYGVQHGQVFVDFYLSYAILLLSANSLLFILLSSHVDNKRGITQALTEAHTLATQDPLTGLLNRRGIEDLIPSLLTKDGSPSCHSILMIDVDHFKHVNDTFGHPAGDQVLIRMAKVIKETVREEAIARFGGEEFAIILRDLSSQQAENVAERIRSNVEKEDLTDIDPSLQRVTVSIGISELLGQEGLSSAICNADRALYEAKRFGRNRVVNENML